MSMPWFKTPPSRRLYRIVVGIFEAILLAIHRSQTAKCLSKYSTLDCRRITHGCQGHPSGLHQDPPTSKRARIFPKAGSRAGLHVQAQAEDRGGTRRNDGAPRVGTLGKGA